MTEKWDKNGFSFGEFGDTATTVMAGSMLSAPERRFVAKPKILNKNQRLKIYLPKGELEPVVEQFISRVGIATLPSDSYQKLAVNMPIEFLMDRASSIPVNIFDSDSECRVGITGSDIVWEYGMGKDAGEELPVFRLTPSIPRPSLYAGATQRLTETTWQEADVYDLEGQLIFTKFKRIANDYFTQKQIPVEIKYRPGGIEGTQYSFPSAGIVDIFSTGKTAKANGITILDKFHDVSMRLITNASKITQFEELVLDEFRDRVAVAVERQRMV